MGARHSRQSEGKQVEDTVTLARQEREKQGPWEVEVSYGGEADLHRHLTGCDKNPGHQKFVPVDQFNVDHLPPGCQDSDLVDLVRVVSDLTVRVSVKYVSEERPKTVPGSGKPYPCYTDSVWDMMKVYLGYKGRGGDMMRVGTGWMWGLDNRYTTCPCQECQISPTPKPQFALIYITTAAHVVYDSLEAAHTSCHLFFDKGGTTPEACSGVVTLSGGLGEDSDVDGDWCEMTFVTHNLDLVDRLGKLVYHCAILRERLKEKLDLLETEKQKSSFPAEDLADVWKGLTIVVSHPHGCSKQISVGYSVDREERCKRMCPLTYTTATCPGSSGACVWGVEDGRQGVYLGYGHVHIGNCEGNKNLNFCSDYRCQPKY